MQRGEQQKRTLPAGPASYGDSCGYGCGSTPVVLTSVCNTPGAKCVAI